MEPPIQKMISGALLVLTVIGVVLYYMVEGVERMFVPSALSKDADPARATM